MSKERLGEIKKHRDEADNSTDEYEFEKINFYNLHVDWLIRTVERYEKALEDISKVGWSDRFGGGFSYTGENHAECIKIAKQTLEGEE